MKKILFGLITLAFLVGCAAKGLMSPAQHIDSSIPAGKSVITFYRPANLGALNNIPIVKESKNGQLEFIGTISRGEKIRVVVPAGTHVFALGGDNSDLLFAKTDADKAYYVRVEPRTFFKASFVNTIVTPGELDDEITKTALAKTDLVQSTPKGQEWFKSNYQRLQEMMVAAKEQYKNEPDSQRYNHTLTPQMGISKLY